jgi:g-D-glutamyl-meso-diaminopimelate peptidase
MSAPLTVGLTYLLDHVFFACKCIKPTIFQVNAVFKCTIPNLRACFDGPAIYIVFRVAYLFLLRFPPAIIFGKVWFNMETVRFESTGPAVELVQLALTRAGYAPGAIDGVFGNATLLAVQRFQLEFGLDPDGIVGPLTFNAMLPYIRGYFRYTVRRGDTFYSIARRYNTTADAITAANPALNPRNLSVGQVITVPFGFNVVPENISYTYDVSEYVIQGLKARYPFLRTGSAGNSVMGKRLTYVSIGTGATQVFYNASHHANEWITSPLVAKFIEEYASAYAFGRRIYDIDASLLYGRTTLYAIPMVNPDGVDLVTGALKSGSFYEQAAGIAENYPSIEFPDGWKANISGVDLNLNYPAEWEQAREIKFAQGFTSPAPRDYVGPSPLSEPESRALYNFTRARDFMLTISYHTQGEVIYWKYLDFQPENSLEIAERFAAASGYEVSETPYESGFAGYKDWFIQEYDRPGYTIEAGLGQNPLPISQLPSIYEKNIGIMALGLQLA